MPSTSDPDGAVFERLRPRLTAISCRIVGSTAEAEDIVQDCFLKWHGADQAALATPAAWLTTVVQHQSIDRLRRRARDEAAAHIALELLPCAPPALPEEGLLRQAELAEALGLLLARLSPAERLAVVLHEVFDCSHADIAAILGTGTANARQHLARARRRLRVLPDEVRLEEKLCRELLRRFQAAINGMDVAAVVNLLAGEQPLSVYAAPSSMGHRACANDTHYTLTLAA
ncbi:sigma-70 family RNA polymerase sigma factor [Massilia sp. IC2-476]|uniref:sigma-70 family RNA polymerase sigma factor n=1 Tax=Massilia sp. IC2-476 TaxID=2887199 RepID=UPI001D0F5CDB|nr:sigma-70 family RNA polymerase sigma factor [Massilia sp. IC2-476]MCC2970687.1 sigma-70 family RNA polymerase sigma factor [Massilia sp. IC2-476]